MKTETTACKKCNRILWKEDADKDGLCVDCRPKTPLRVVKPKDKKEDD